MTALYPGFGMRACGRMLAGMLLCIDMLAFADQSLIDKIYHPYVQPGERELEFRALLAADDGRGRDDWRNYRLGYGQSLSESWFAECYLLGEGISSDSLRIRSYELEALWQISEQGEFWADWGMLFELERDPEKNGWELATALLVEKEWGQWSVTGNVYAIYEWGEGLVDEFETALAWQARYRYSRRLEPALEFYVDQRTRGAGLVLLGNIRGHDRQKLHWELGVIFALDENTPDQIFKGLLEWEF